MGRTGVADENKAQCPVTRCNLWPFKFGSSGYSGLDEDQHNAFVPQNSAGWMVAVRLRLGRRI